MKGPKSPLLSASPQMLKAWYTTRRAEGRPRMANEASGMLAIVEGALSSILKQKVWREADALSPRE
eukprot:1153076-Pelagomonas_calceolata.AAC.1